MRKFIFTLIVAGTVIALAGMAVLSHYDLKIRSPGVSITLADDGDR